MWKAENATGRMPHIFFVEYAQEMFGENANFRPRIRLQQSVEKLHAIWRIFSLLSTFPDDQDKGYPSDRHFHLFKSRNTRFQPKTYISIEKLRPNAHTWQLCEWSISFSMHWGQLCAAIIHFLTIKYWWKYQEQNFEWMCDWNKSHIDIKLAKKFILTFLSLSLTEPL